MKKTGQLLKVLLAACIMVLCMAGFDTPASAATKEIAVGVEYEPGDSISFNKDRLGLDPFAKCYIKLIVGTHWYSSNFSSEAIVGEMVEYEYEKETYRHTIQIGTEPPISVVYYADTTKIFEAIICTGGTGIEDDPFILQMIKPRASVSNPPTAKENLVYTGYAQELVTSGSGFTGATDEENKIFYYVTTDKDFTPDTTSAFSDKAEGTNAKTYYVWYVVLGDSEHNNSKPARIETKIDKASIDDFSISYTSQYEYTGATIVPAFTLKDDNGHELTSDEYTLSYEYRTETNTYYGSVNEIKAVGPYRVTVNGKGNYKGSKTFGVTVVKPGRKEIKVGEIYRGEDYIVFGAGCYISGYNSGNSSASYLISNEQKVEYSGYNAGTKIHTISLGTTGCKWTCNSDSAFNRPRGLKCVSGSGTAADPYIFELIGPAAFNVDSSVERSIVFGDSALSAGCNTENAAKVYFGNNGSSPLSWRIIGYNGAGVASSQGDATLLLNDIWLKSKFDNRTRDSNEYNGSVLKSVIDGLTGTNSIFSNKEISYIEDRSLDDIAGAEVTGAKLWPLSIKEAEGVNNELRKLNRWWWWLRSRGWLEYDAASVMADGRVDVYGDYVSGDYDPHDGCAGVRPAFNLNLESVLFTSAALGGKDSGPIGSNCLEAEGDYTGIDWKLTLKDSGTNEYRGDHYGFKAYRVNDAGEKIDDPEATSDYLEEGKYIRIKFSGAQTGVNEYVSAMLVDITTGKILYYGHLANGISSSNGINIYLPALPDATHDYSLKIFAEQCNGDYKTDYASDVFEVATFRAARNSILLGTDELKTWANEHGADKVYYGISAGDKPVEWSVIGYNGKGVASGSEDVTLFSADNLLGTSVFNAPSRKNNEYNGSTLRSVIDGLSGSNSIFTLGELATIKDRTLPVGTYISETSGYSDGVARSEVTGAKLWPLSAMEASKLNHELRDFSEGWWLRSPGERDYLTAYVLSGGSLFPRGYQVDMSLGVHPAFNLKMSSVLFISAAEGGKTKAGTSGNALGLSKVPSYTGNRWKLTIDDAGTETDQLGHYGFIASRLDSGALPAGDSVTVSYSGAATNSKADRTDGTGEYVSAMLVDGTGKAIYYGHIVACSSVDSASGKVDITIPEDVPDGNYILKVFSEKCNGDRKTDYASKIYDFAIEVAHVSRVKSAPELISDLEYNGEARDLVNAGNAAKGTMEYAVITSADGALADTAAPVETDYSSTIPSGTDAGTYHIWYRVKGDAGYSDVAPVKLGSVAISRKPVLVSGITAKDKSYDGTADVTFDTGKVTFTGKLDKDSLTVSATGSFASINAGSGETVNISGLVLGGTDVRNYVLAQSGQQTGTTAAINPAKITVTAKSGESTYGEEISLNGFDVTGAYVAGDDLGVQLETEAKKESDAGTYDIVVKSWTNTNYDVTKVNGIYTIKKADQTKPDAPALSEATKDSITLIKVDGYEYRRGNGNWQSDNVFSDLNQNTSYTFYQRKAADKNHNVSPVSDGAEYKTDKESVPVTQTSRPIFRPAGDNYYEAQNVTITCETEGAAIYYTTDGSIPTTGSMVYSTAIAVSETTTIKAMAVKEGMLESEIVSETYKFPYELVFDPGDGGSGLMNPVFVFDGDTYTFPECGFAANEGKAFDYWEMSGCDNTNVVSTDVADGKFKPGSTIKIAGNCAMENKITVTAYWKEHVHNWTYSSNGETITAKCAGAGTCPVTSGLSITISAPADLIYDGNPKAATFNTDYSTTAFPGSYEIKYVDKDGVSITAADVRNAGIYTAKLTAGNTTASLKFEIEQKKVTVKASAQTVKQDAAIKTGISMASLEGALPGHTLSAVTLKSGNTAAATTSGKITPSNAVIKDANGNDVTKNYDITYVDGNLTVIGKKVKKVTFKVVNGSWNDGKTEDITVTLTGYEGDTLKLKAEDIPAVGKKPNDTYKAGSWNKTPEAGAEINSDITYTYTFAKKDSISSKVTFKVVNGSWDDGKTEDITVTLTGHEGDTLKLKAEDIPAVGKKPNDTYKAGSWNKTPEAGAEINSDITYTYTFAKKDSISSKVTFKVVNGSWDDGKIEDITVTLTGYEGETLKLKAEDIPAVGKKPNDTYKAGSWNKTPEAGTVITGDTTYTYTFTRKDSISRKVTFKVVNGSWDDGKTEDITVTLTGYEGDTLKLKAENIPAVGKKPNDTYKAGSWNVKPEAGAEINSDITYTYTFAKKDSISSKVTFKVVNGSWDDGKTEDITVTLTGYEGDTLKLKAENIPAVGKKPNDTYKAGSWNVTPDTDTAITSDTTYIYTFTRKDSISSKVTFKVVNGSWDNGKTEDITVTLTGHEGDTLKLKAEDIPAVGKKPNDTYKAGSWNVKPEAGAEINSDITYTYTFAKKDSISSKVTFKVVNGFWDNGKTEDITVTLTGYEGETLKLKAEDIPQVGKKPNDTYKAGSWNVTPDTDTAINSDITYTYTFTKKDSISRKVTFKVVNGSWDNGKTEDIIVTLTGYEGETLKLKAEDIPQVGKKPNATYKAGSWNVTPNTSTSITADTTYIYRYAAKDEAVVKKAPEAKVLTYSGSAQELVSAGEATGGDMMYALGDETKANGAYSASIPTGIEAGTYYVWYKVAGKGDYKDSMESYVTVKIDKVVTSPSPSPSPSASPSPSPSPSASPSPSPSPSASPSPSPSATPTQIVEASDDNSPKTKTYPYTEVIKIYNEDGSITTITTTYYEDGSIRKKIETEWPSGKKDTEETLRDGKKKLLYKMTEKVRFSSEGTKSVKTTIRQSDGYRYSSLDRTYKSGKGSLTVKATTADKTVIRIKESRKANGSLIRKNLETDPKGITELTITEKDSIGKKTVAVYRLVGKGKVSLTKLTTNKETVTIPSKVSYNKKEGYKVVSIAKKALKGNKTIKNLTIGKNVVKIGGSAFAGLNSIEEVIFKSGNKVKISKGAFSGTGTETRFSIYADEPEYTYIVNRIKKAGAPSDAIFEMKTAKSKTKK